MKRLEYTLLLLLMDKKEKWKSERKKHLDKLAASSGPV